MIYLLNNLYTLNNILHNIVPFAHFFIGQSVKDFLEKGAHEMVEIPFIMLLNFYFFLSLYKTNTPPLNCK